MFYTYTVKTVPTHICLQTQSEDKQIMHKKKSIKIPVSYNHRLKTQSLSICCKSCDKTFFIAGAEPRHLQSNSSAWTEVLNAILNPGKYLRHTDRADRWGADLPAFWSSHWRHSGILRAIKNTSGNLNLGTWIQCFASLASAKPLSMGHSHYTRQWHFCQNKVLFLPLLESEVTCGQAFISEGFFLHATHLWIRV